MSLYLLLLFSNCLSPQLTYPCERVAIFKFFDILSTRCNRRKLKSLPKILMISHFGFPEGLQWECWVSHILSASSVRRRAAEPPPTPNRTDARCSYTCLSRRTHSMLSSWEAGNALWHRVLSTEQPHIQGHLVSYLMSLSLLPEQVGLISYRLSQPFSLHVLLCARLWRNEWEKKHLVWLDGGRWGWTEQNFFFFSILKGQEPLINTCKWTWK